jgi:hypothetical protein
MALTQFAGETVAAAAITDVWESARGSQRQAVADLIGFGAAIGAQMRGLQRCGGVAAGDGALPAVGFEQDGAEVGLATPGDNVQACAQPGVVVVCRRVFRLGAVLSI